jgi:amidase
MLSSDPALWTTSEQRRAIAALDLGSVELFDAQVARIDRLNPEINAVCTLDLERGRAECRRADELAAGGISLGPLHGIPITIKDAIDTAGLRSTGGSTDLQTHVPVADAPVVASLRQAGATVFGKTNLPEWSGDWQAFNAMFGTTNNPWDLSRMPGGSSGGAAAAVATGMTSFEIGTDIGGSVRVPSAFCGVFGHKPSFGVIPTLGYLDEPNGGGVESDVNVFGPIARSAEDLRLILDITAGPTPDRAVAWRLDLPECKASDLDGLRIGVWFDEPKLPQDPEMMSVLHALLPKLVHAGALVDIDTRPSIDLTASWIGGAQIIGAAAGVSYNNQGTTHTDWLFADRNRARTRAAWADYFRHIDVLLCPVSITPAIPHNQEGTLGSRWMKVSDLDVRYVLLGVWTALIGSVYLPSTSVPVGHTPGGLPVGIQVVAPYLHDRTAITVGGLIADVADGYRVPPCAL